MVEAREYALWLEEWERQRTANKEQADNTLVIWKNGLTELPDVLQRRNNMMVVDLRYNRVRELPPDLSLLRLVVHLDLTQNDLCTIPPGITVLQDLKGLFLAKNKLEALPPEMGYLPSLEVLRLERNKIFEVPYHIGYLPELRTLHLESNRLTSLPPEIALLTKLDSIHLYGNPLITPTASRVGDAAPSALGDAPLNSYIQDEREADHCFKTNRAALARTDHDGLLEHLAQQLLTQDFSLSDLSCFPDSVLRTTTLLSLGMSRNDLVGVLPTSIECLNGLRLLDVSHNKITHLPYALTALKDLQELNLSHNRMANTCRRNRMEEEMCFPMELGETMAGLRTLLLAHNKLSWVPLACMSLPLHILDVSHNDLEFLPDFQRHHIMPDELKVFNAGNNHIREMDSAFIHRLKSLEVFIVETNLLEHLPPLGSLSETAKMLWAGQNRLREIPVSVGKLTKLVSLRLEANLFQTVPVEIGMCERLEDINLLNNPHLYQPPPEMLVRGPKALLAFLQRLLQATSTHSKEVESAADVSAEELEAELFAEQSLNDEQEEEEYDDTGTLVPKKKKKPPTKTQLFASAMQQDAEGIPIHHQVQVSESSAVLYLNQPCYLLRVYQEGANVFADMEHRETGQLFVRIKHDMVIQP